MLAISPVTLGITEFEEASKLASEAGYSGVGIRYDQLERYLDAGHSIEDARSLLQSLRLVASEAGFLAQWQFYGGIPLVSRRSRVGERTDEPYLLGRMEQFFERSRALGVQSITAGATPERSGTIEEAARDFARVCGFAQPYGLNVAFEFFGNSKSIATLADAVQVVALAAAPNGRLLIDTFFFYQGGSQPDDVRLLRDSAAKVGAVQIADAAPGPRKDLDMLAGRRLPGEGVAPLRLILDEIRQLPYLGWYTIEVFNQPMARETALEVARRARSSSACLLGERHSA